MTNAFPNTPSVVPNTPVQRLEIYTDGSAKGSAGGYVAVVCGYADGALISPNIYTGGSIETTCERTKVSSVLLALKTAELWGNIPCKIYTSHRNIPTALKEWLPNWLANDWRNASGQPVANRDLWQEVHARCEGQAVEIIYAPKTAFSTMAKTLAREQCEEWVAKANLAMMQQAA